MSSRHFFSQVEELFLHIRSTSKTRESKIAMFVIQNSRFHYITCIYVCISANANPTTFLWYNATVYFKVLTIVELI